MILSASVACASCANVGAPRAPGDAQPSWIDAAAVADDPDAVRVVDARDATGEPPPDDATPCLPRGVALDAAGSYAVGSRRRHEGARVIVARDRDGLFALSAICTHAGCTVDLDAIGYVCPCHYSEYHDDGSVRAGPARERLAPVAVCVRGDGVVVVDPRIPAALGARVRVG